MRALLLVFAVVSTLPTLPSFAQSQRAEFIESSSPLPGGGAVTSRSTPGQPMQTVAVSPETPLVSSNDSIQSNLTSKTTEPAQQRNAVFRQTPIIQNNNVVPRYAYPVSRVLPRNRVSQTALFYQPVRATATCTNCAVPYQIPTLGLTNTVQTARQNYAQGHCCSPVTGTNTVLQVPAAQVPTLQIQPPASQVPTLNVPNTNPQVFQTAPNLGVPQFNTQQNRFLNPFVTGSGAYQPIIRIANVPPGTYVGQGIIGQPVAYVDGQPVRNLLRYVFP